MSDMREITLDVSACYSPEDVHDVLGDVLPLPAYYGGNLDALFDALTEVGQPTALIFEGTASAASVIGEKFMRSFRRMCEEAAEANDRLQIRFLS